MPQSRIITDDKGTRQNVKIRLAQKIDLALEPKPVQNKDTRLLLLPTNYEELSESELHFVLTHNAELRHTYQSAYLAADILYGRIEEPTNVKFQTIRLESPVEIPVYTQFAPIQTHRIKSGLPAIPADSTPIRKAQDKTKREEFKRQLASKTQKTASPSPGIEPERVLFIPDNYEGLSEAGLHHVLTQTVELGHSHDSAMLAMDIILERIPCPENIQFRIVKLVKAKEEPKQRIVNVESIYIPDTDIPKREEFKKSLADKIDSVLNSPPPQPIIEEEVKPIEFTLPEDWRQIPSVMLRTDLLSQGLTPEQTNTVMSSLKEPEFRVERLVEEDRIEELLVDLPEEFSTWRFNEQYIYLTKDRKLTPERANEVIYNGTHNSSNRFTS